MNSSIIRNVARKMSDCDLVHVARTLQGEVMQAISNGERGTQAHIGKIEMIDACSTELWDRGYEHGTKRDGSDLPKDIATEDGIRYQISVRVF